MLKFVKIIFISLLSLALCQAAQHWSYDGQTNADEWSGQCREGLRQSPIEVSPEEAVRTTADPFVFEFYDNPPVAETLTNNGHSITLTMKAKRDISYPKVIGGGLPGVFQFEQFHFHWGAVDARGSEHNIFGSRHPMELHLVHFNPLFGSSLNEALNMSENAYNTLAVLAVFFEIQEKDNPAIDPITDMLKFIKFQNDVVNNVTLFTLENLLPENRNQFFRYNGSLTTPPCSEVVIWTIFKDPIYISEAQMLKFREVGNLPRNSNDEFEPESDNFRDIQAKNGRKVLLIDTSREAYVVDHAGEHGQDHHDLDHDGGEPKAEPGQKSSGKKLTWSIFILVISLTLKLA